MNIPERILKSIGDCPKTGGGVNDWLFKTSIKLGRYLNTHEIASFLAASVSNCGRTVTAAEIRRQVERGTNLSATEWEPHVNYVKSFHRELSDIRIHTSAVRKIVNEGFSLADLFHESPYHDRDCDEIIDSLFPGNPWICCGWDKSRFLCRRREFFRDEMAQYQFIVPTPSVAQWGYNTDGLKSEHCLSNTGDRRFIVVEFDYGTKDDQAAILWHLQQYGILTLVVDSQGKSLHGWFYCLGLAEERLKKFFRYARTLGADPIHWTRSQFTRMPRGSRDGKEQAVYYFDPTYARPK